MAHAKHQSPPAIGEEKAWWGLLLREERARIRELRTQQKHAW
jgi:hypothetical protein